jgi:hypothetical protein
MRALTDADDACDLLGWLMEMGESGWEMILAFEYGPENLFAPDEICRIYGEALSERRNSSPDQ